MSYQKKGHQRLRQFFKKFSLICADWEQINNKKLTNNQKKEKVTHTLICRLTDTYTPLVSSLETTTFFRLSIIIRQRIVFGRICKSTREPQYTTNYTTCYAASHKYGICVTINTWLWLFTRPVPVMYLYTILLYDIDII